MPGLRRGGVSPPYIYVVSFVCKVGNECDTFNSRMSVSPHRHLAQPVFNNDDFALPPLRRRQHGDDGDGDEEGDGEESELDLNSPRVKAACRVMGLSQDEFRRREESEFQEKGLKEGNKDVLKLRSAMWEKKRRRLIREVKETAELLQENEVAKLIDESAPVVAVAREESAGNQQTGAGAIDAQVEALRAKKKEQVKRLIQSEFEERGLEERRKENEVRAKMMIEENRIRKEKELKELKKKRDAKDAVIKTRLEASAVEQKRHQKDVEEKLNQALARSFSNRKNRLPKPVVRASHSIETEAEHWAAEAQESVYHGYDVGSFVIQNQILPYVFHDA